MNISGTNKILELISGHIFEYFKKCYPGENHYYFLDTNLLVNAVNNAKVDIERVAEFHSPKSGADIYRQVAYTSKWIADIKPIQVQGYPQNLPNSHFLDLMKINSTFAVFFISIALYKHKEIADSLLRDLQYCFEYRHIMPADALAILLKHSPDKKIT